ncbi:putative low-complexity protein [Rivularia sp. PCC 7116]|uniref:serine/threonine-protein kinase n=1 Tax=Rivularia sp. PCC 7116 TaxID=373994 RepID=UPI00029F22D8|nr:putative low-complexity protein [Rivularia sp. PCC 7116]
MAIQKTDFSHLGYQVNKELGKNRFGGRITHLAEVENTDEKVVIKEFRFADVGADWSGFKAYEREIEVLQQLNHPRIPSYLTSFETPQGFCLVQEYKDAPSLASENKFTPEQVKQIAISILEILVYLQQRDPQIIHRDIKPENILVDKNLNAYLVDFGFAKVSNNEVALSSVASGTPGFIPPEEYFGRDLTEASDLYSLGVTLICLLSGTRSVNVGKLIDDEYRFDFKSFPSNIHPKFAGWLGKMVEPNLKHRFASAAEALEALRSIPVVVQQKSKESNVFAQSFALLILLWVGIAGTQGIQRSTISQQHKIERQQRQIYRLRYKQRQLETRISRINRLQELLQEREQTHRLLDRLQKKKECEDCELQKVNLSNSQIENVSLKNANLRHINLENSNLQSSNLSGTNLKYARLQRAILKDTNLQDANLRGARLRSAVLKNANLSNANLTYANLTNVDLRGADLRGARLHRTKLNGADLSGANLRYTNLHGIDLNNVKLTGATMPDGTIHP